MHTSSIPNVQLLNGVSMPQFGLGVWQAAEGNEVETAVTTALESGYRLIDTAAVYGNEVGVGRAIKASGVPRKELFITTKVWNADQGFESTLEAFQASLDKLDCEYVDLYLIHWPMPATGKYVETWKALEQLYREGKVQAIGVSNFKPSHLKHLLAETEIVPMVNQIELHPRLQQIETREFCAKEHIQIESYSPLMQGGELFSDSAIVALSEKYGKTPAQIILRWHIQEGFVVIPKSVTPARIKENMDIFDFALSEKDIEVIRSLNQDKRIGSDPDKF